jgi:hypothetical protein
MADLYEDDFLLWSEHQADLLRRLARGERVNDQIDWDNLVEEVESVGRDQLHAVESLLLQSLVPMLKAEAWPAIRDADSWRSDSLLFRLQAAKRYVPSMRQRLDLQQIYGEALEVLPQTMDGQQRRPLPETCPATPDELLRR